VLSGEAEMTGAKRVFILNSSLRPLSQDTGGIYRTRLVITTRRRVPTDIHLLEA